MSLSIDSIGLWLLCLVAVCVAVVMADWAIQRFKSRADDHRLLQIQLKRMHVALASKDLEIAQYRVRIEMLVRSLENARRPAYNIYPLRKPS